jgi:hypothetical protein
MVGCSSENELKELTVWNVAASAQEPLPKLNFSMVNQLKFAVSVIGEFMVIVGEGLVPV